MAVGKKIVTIKINLLICGKYDLNNNVDKIMNILLIFNHISGWLNQFNF